MKKITDFDYPTVVVACGLATILFMLALKLSRIIAVYVYNFIS